MGVSDRSDSGVDLGHRAEGRLGDIDRRAIEPSERVVSVSRVLLDTGDDLRMRSLHDEQGTTFVFSTHDPRVIVHATRVVTLEDGKVVSDVRKDAGDSAA